MALVNSNFYRPQTKFAKVMFLHLSVILSTGGGGACVAGGACVGGRGVRGRRACVAEGGVCMAGGYAWQWGCAWQGMCVAGRHAWQGGHVWQGGMHGRGGVHGRGHTCHTCPLPPTLRDTHPTGMHHCLFCFRLIISFLPM